MRFGFRYFAYGLVCFTLSGRCLSQDVAGQTKPATSVTVASVAGCYELKMGRWWPWGFGGDNEFVTPARKIELLAVPGTNGFEQYGSQIRTIPPVKENGSIHRFSYWNISADGHVELNWTTGFSGVALSMEKHGEMLIGWAHPHFDFPTLIPRVMHVTARRIACKPIQNSP